MRKIILFDTKESHTKLLPLTYTRPVAEIRIGILTIFQKWQRTGHEIKMHSQSYFYHPLQIKTNDVCLFVDATVCPTRVLLDLLTNLSHTESIICDGQTIAFVGTLEEYESENYLLFNSWKIAARNLLKINHISDVFSKNDEALRHDYEGLTFGKTSAPLEANCTEIGDNLFLEDGASAKGAIFNTEEGPIYIAKGALVMEGAMLRGPIYIGEHAVVKMGAKIYGATTIGPYCKVGGEISNSVFFGYSNKGHDGFLGNSVIGEWCNLGADTNTSNLKNNYGEIKTWSYPSKQLENTGLIFHGLIMGDHAKAGINTMFNTGTTVGVCANVFGGGFPPKFIPSFSWGGKDGFVEHELNKAIATSEKVYARRKIEMNLTAKSILEHIFKKTKEFRT